MGILACLLFGIISGWITRSLMTKSPGGYKEVLLIGLIGGALGLFGITIGWGDFDSFNLYNVLLSIACSAVLMTIYAKLFAKFRLAD